MGRVSKKNIKYSRFTEGCTAEFIGDPDEQGTQAARITDPTMNDGKPFMAITKVNEWSDLPLVSAPADLPETVNVIIWQDKKGLHMDVDTSADPTKEDWPKAIGTFRVILPKMLTQLS